MWVWRESNSRLCQDLVLQTSVAIPAANHTPILGECLGEFILVYNVGFKPTLFSWKENAQSIKLIVRSNSYLLLPNIFILSKIYF